MGRVGGAIQGAGRFYGDLPAPIRWGLPLGALGYGMYALGEYMAGLGGVKPGGYSEEDLQGMGPLHKVPQ